MKTRMIKSITTATLTTLLVAGSVTFAKSEETNKAIKHKVLAKKKEVKTCMVPQNEVVAYLEGFGYSNVTFLRSADPCLMVVGTDYSYNTFVYLSGNNIVGHVDVE